MERRDKVAIGIVVGIATALGIYTLTRAVGPRADVAFQSILPHLEIAYYWNPKTDSWELVFADTRIRDGGMYSISVTADCTLTYDGYYYGLTAGWNEIVWQKQ